MTYNELNNQQRRKIVETCNPSAIFEWEDEELLEILSGNLPELRYGSTNGKSPPSLFGILKKSYEAYDFFSFDTTDYLEKLETAFKKTQEIAECWCNRSMADVKEYIKMQKGCLISGDGGSGKTYFIECLEQGLQDAHKKHLVVYGKFLNTLEKVQHIDFAEIAAIAESEEFVFVIDAINEIEEEGREYLKSRISRIKAARGMRVIITYRNGTIGSDFSAELSALLGSEYLFPGVSFDSTLEWLRGEGILNLEEYEDVLYTNNPLLLGMLPRILRNLSEKELNNVCRFTYIYEHYIRDTIDKFLWEQTKIVSVYLCSMNKKWFEVQELNDLIPSPNEYVRKMKQYGFLTPSVWGEEERYYFTIEALGDYLIARAMLDEITGDDLDQISKALKEKIAAFRGMNRETVVLLLFDKLSSYGYSEIKEILEKTELISHFNYSVIEKLHFQKEEILEFLKVFCFGTFEEAFLYFAGSTNKPFNCTSLLNRYLFLNPSEYQPRLSKCLEGKYRNPLLKRRLKNILNLVAKSESSYDELSEVFFAALWCTCASDPDIRNMAMKLLYEVLQRSEELTDRAIDLFDSITDEYIQDAIIFVLSSCQKKKSNIESFFNQLLQKETFVLSKSIKRICTYLNTDTAYISMPRENVFLNQVEAISPKMKDMLFHVDLIDSSFFPFRVSGGGEIDSMYKFLADDKATISKFLERISTDFACVKTGVCKGRYRLGEKIESYYSYSFSGNLIGGEDILKALEHCLRNIFDRYHLPFSREAYSGDASRYFEASLFKKCFSIAIDQLYGSLMCNYYTNEFSAFDIQDTIGYVAYDPLKYDETIHITSPITNQQSFVKKLERGVARKLPQNVVRDEVWVHDMEITRRNLLELLAPFEIKGEKWRMLAGRVTLTDPHLSTSWQDKYLIQVCTSPFETITGHHEDRYLTIEVDDYTGNLKDYVTFNCRSWLCKRVSPINSASNCFDETKLLLPPAELVRHLNLSINLSDLCWYNSSGEKVIVCNNNKVQGTQDQITQSIFIKEEIYQMICQEMPLKFFAFTEKCLPGQGFCAETDHHFEIEGDRILKEYPNDGGRTPLEDETVQACTFCPYGFLEPPHSHIPSKLEEFIKLYDAGYNS